MINNDKPLRFRHARKTLGLAVVVAVIAVISCSKAQPAAGLDALDQKKLTLNKLTLHKITLDTKEQQLLVKIKVGKFNLLKKDLIDIVIDSTGKRLQQKKDLELSIIKSDEDAQALLHK